MLTRIRQLIEELTGQGIRYCHWKSNRSLKKALLGQTDVDILVHRRDADLFRTVMSQVGFQPVVVDEGASYPSVEHYVGLDEESGMLVDVHAYFRVITGESLVKNYRLPIEEMLLTNLREVDGVRVPTKPAELVVFTVRMMLKHTSLVELALVAREGDHVQRELEWLMEADPLADAMALVDRWLPPVDTALFADCVAALRVPAPLLQRVILGHRLRAQLRLYARHSMVQATLSGMGNFTIRLLRRLTGRKKGMAPQTGGAVIAFVGSEATGKSTLLAEVRSWLAEYFTVEQVHAGKPQSTLLTVLPNLFLPALRSLLPSHRSGNVGNQYAGATQVGPGQKVYPLSFAVRSALLAYDRRALLARAFKRAANGTIVLCDRYPSLCSGAPDSPQLLHLSVPPDRYPLRRRLAQVEKQLYEEIPAPDLIISLSVPLEVAVIRNRTRGKTEPEEFVRLRHAQSAKLDFGATPLCKINTDQPLDETLLQVKKAIWDAL